MKLSLLYTLILTGLLFSGTTLTATADGLKRNGCVVARAICPAYASKKKRTNPGFIKTEVDVLYRLLAINAKPATHYLLEFPGANPKMRWVKRDCLQLSANCPAKAGILPRQPKKTATQPTPKTYSSRNILAVSWQPGFCETRPNKRECRGQTPDHYDATHFSLHGLWPQPRDNQYCRVTAKERRKDERGFWRSLDPLALSKATRQKLEKIMPGTLSHLHRHEWVKHGACYSKTAETYYSHSITLIEQLNNSAVQRLFKSHIGRNLTLQQVRQAFDISFGKGAGERVSMLCALIGNRRVVKELLLRLEGSIAQDDDLGSLMLAASPTRRNPACRSGLVDKAGF